MIGKQFRYKELDFTDELQRQLMDSKGYCYPLQNISYNLQERTQISLNENYHGGLLSSTLYGVRYFDFEGVAVGMDKEHRGLVTHLLRSQINLEANPQKNPYYHLFWLSDDGRPVFCKAKVTKAIELKNALGDIRMPYTFQLASPSEKYYGIELKEVTKRLGSAGGTSLEV